MQSPDIQKQVKKRDYRKKSKDPLADLPFWLHDFKENLKERELHAPAHSSPESEKEHPTKVATKSRKCSVETHFPKRRNCDVCLRTKMTRALSRRRTGEAPPRAEKFGDLTTADHKVLNEGCESRDTQRYTVVVQDLATQWIQSSPCQTKTSRETERVHESSLSRHSQCLHKGVIVLHPSSPSGRILYCFPAATRYW